MGLFGFGERKKPTKKDLPTTKYTVTVTFDRKNPKTGILERDMERWGDVWAPDAATARIQFLDQMKKNEPTLIGLRTIKVQEVKVKASPAPRIPAEPECPTCGGDKTCERCDA